MNIIYPELTKEIRSHITTKQAAYYLNRKPQTLYIWACSKSGPLQPIRVNGQLAWSVNDIKTLLEIK